MRSTSLWCRSRSRKGRKGGRGGGREGGREKPCSTRTACCVVALSTIRWTFRRCALNAASELFHSKKASWAAPSCWGREGGREGGREEGVVRQLAKIPPSRTCDLLTPSRPPSYHTRQLSHSSKCDSNKMLPIPAMVCSSPPSLPPSSSSSLSRSTLFPKWRRPSNASEKTTP